MQRILIILAVLVVAGVAIRFGLYPSQPTTIEALEGEVTISSLLVDFGEIDQSGGVVSSTVEVLNTGEGVLEIYRISTSCGCTTAQMDTSPLASGEQRTLTIEFDPMVHPDESGPITRVVYIQSSDPSQPEVAIDVRGTVIPESL